MDLILQKVIDWCAEHNVDPNNVTLHSNGTATIKATGYPTQQAYSLFAAMRGLEIRIAKGDHVTDGRHDRSVE